MLRTNKNERKSKQQHQQHNQAHTYNFKHAVKHMFLVPVRNTCYVQKFLDLNLRKYFERPDSNK